MTDWTGLDVWTMGILGGFLLTMPLYRVVRGRRVLDPDLPHRPRSVLLGSWLKEWLLWVISPVERAAVRRGIAPEVFNYVGLILSAGAGAALAAGFLPLGALLYLLCGAADVLDGRIARARGVSSEYGAFLDSTLDRFAETFVFLGLAWYFRSWPAAGLFCLLALAGSLLVSYTRARGQGVGVDFNKGIMQRAERIVLLSAAALFDGMVTAWLEWARGTLMAVTVLLIGVGSMVTAVYRTTAIGRRLRG
ncbi:MAG: CDP-alcohol phosphatidyltransferase family protein [Thermoanaerobaculia bacterium]